MLALGLAVASATLAIGWMAFHQLRSDLADSNARLPAKVGSVLSGGAPSTGSGTFLIAAPQGGIPGAVLMRVDPSTGVATTVELGSRARVGANRVGDLTTRGDVTALVGALAQEGIPVNHVLLLAPGQIGNMIDGLGGIAVSAPTAVTLLDTSGRSFGIRPGQIRLKGALADAYLFGQEQGDPTASPEQRQLDGLAAVGAAVLEPSSATLRTPNHLGGVIAKNTATDLTATTYLDELHAWGDVSRTVSCGAVDPSADATSMLAVLAGKGAASATPATCSTASVRPSGVVPAAGPAGQRPRRHAGAGGRARAARCRDLPARARAVESRLPNAARPSAAGVRPRRGRRRRQRRRPSLRRPCRRRPPSDAGCACPTPCDGPVNPRGGRTGGGSILAGHGSGFPPGGRDGAPQPSPADFLSASGGFGDTTTWWVDAATWRAMLPCSRWPSARDS